MEGEGGAGVVRNHIDVCNPMRDRFPSLFQNIALGGLKFSSYQLNHLVDISCYLTKVTTPRYFTELAFLISL